MVTTDIVRRLAFAKYVYMLGVDQVRLPEPMSAAALFNFHDAVELHLQLAAEHLDVGKNRVTFAEYWDLLSSKLTEPVSQKEAMRRLNTARNALKHSGTRPSAQDLVAFRESATRYFDENTPRLFGVEFAKISLIDFVASDEAKGSLNLAAATRESGDLENATGQIALAFQQLLDSYEDRKTRWGTSPFSFGRNLQFLSSRSIKIDRVANRAMADFVDGVRDSIDSLQLVAKMLALGIDYRRFSRFRIHTPNVQRMMAGNYVVTFPYPRPFELTGDDVDFCFTFVIETALALQGFDYDTPNFTPEATGQKPT